MSLTCNINTIYAITSCALETTMSIYIPHMSLMQSIMCPVALVYILFTLLPYAPWTTLPPTLKWYMSYCTFDVVYIQTLYYYIHLLKINKLQNLFTILLHNMCHQYTCLSNSQSMAYSQITLCAFIWEVCQHKCYIWSCSHQWCSQICCTQTMMTVILTLMMMP